MQRSIPNLPVDYHKRCLWFKEKIIVDLFLKFPFLEMQPKERCISEEEKNCWKERFVQVVR